LSFGFCFLLSALKIVFSIADLQPESGGPSRSVSALATAVAELGVEVELLALEYGGGRNAPMIPQKSVQTKLVPCRGGLAVKFRRSPEFEAALRKGCADCSEVSGQRSVVGRPNNSIIHDNGLWLPTNHVAARVARRMQIPFIISPRGMLTPWAMRYHGFKKRLAWFLYQRRDLQSAQVLHATSHQEAAEFRALGLTQPIAVVPNGVSLPSESPNCECRKQKLEAPHPGLLPRAEREDGGQWSEVRGQKSEIRTVLFLSRIHPKKGLLDLVEAWATVNRKSEIGNRKSGEWRVVVAGGDEKGHLETVKAEIRKQKLENSFEFVGEVPDDKKWDLYRSADLFVLPTKSENFGIVIAEALACGLPVITTRGAPWEDLITHHCGWWIEIGANPLAVALNEALRLPDEDRRAMGRRGRKLVGENYTWPAAAKKMVAVYQWMLGGGAKPECVHYA
jgi:glycosyltransferase involved in cell wall biosynthesis